MDYSYVARSMHFLLANVDVFTRKSSLRFNHWIALIHFWTHNPASTPPENYVLRIEIGFIFRFCALNNFGSNIVNLFIFRGLRAPSMDRLTSTDRTVHGGFTTALMVQITDQTKKCRSLRFHRRKLKQIYSLAFLYRNAYFHRELQFPSFVGQ